MTARQMYEAVLAERNKVGTSTMLLEDFNYFANKAIRQYINKRYTLYDTSQQTTDDLRVLKASAKLNVNKVGGLAVGTNNLYGAVYEAVLPSDYYHILSCVCEYDVNQTYECHDSGDVWHQGATKLTADQWASIINNSYMRPSYRRPYYYIHNDGINGPLNQEVQTEKFTETDPSTTDRVITIGDGNLTQDNPVERQSHVGNAYQRYGNASPVRIEIRYGKDDTVFKLKNIYVDYLKTPQHIRLTPTQIDLTVDTSQLLEFPDYVCQEIINELVMLIMENEGDGRLQTFIPLSQSIANPQIQQQS